MEFQLLDTNEQQAFNYRQVSKSCTLRPNAAPGGWAVFRTDPIQYATTLLIGTEAISVLAPLGPKLRDPATVVAWHFRSQSSRNRARPLDS